MGKRKKYRKDKSNRRDKRNQTNNKGNDTKMHGNYSPYNAQRALPAGTTQQTTQTVRGSSAELNCDFYMDTDVKARFDEYARAAKTEIGGLLRVQRDDNGDYIAVDIKIFPQQATGATFSLDEDAVTRFMMECYKEDKSGHLMREWCNIIHSHPNNTAPFLSGVDRPNLISIAGSNFAWSVIMTRVDKINTSGTNYKVHFYRAPSDDGFGILVQDLPVWLRDRRRAEIEAEVKELILPPVSYTGNVGSWRGNHQSSAQQRGVQYGWDWDEGYNDASGYPGYSRPYSEPVSDVTDQELESILGQTRTEDEDAQLAKEIAEEIQAEFLSMDIEEGALVKFVPTEFSYVGEAKKDVKILKEMAGEDFVVEGFCDSTGRVQLNGYLFDPDEVELVMTRDGKTPIEVEAELEADEAEA